MLLPEGILQDCESQERPQLKPSGDLGDRFFLAERGGRVRQVRLHHRFEHIEPGIHLAFGEDERR